jgi:hypothetical protein
VRPSIATVKVDMWKEVGRAACWTELDCADLVLSCSELDSSIRSRDDFFISHCRY